MEKNIQELLISAIKDVLKELKFTPGSKEELFLDLPKDNRFGELTTNIALRISSQVKIPPFEVANAIVNQIKKFLKNNHLEDYIEEVKVQNPGFINFYLKDDYFYKQLKNILLKEKGFAKSDLGKGKRVLIEFVSANPTGPLSVAHARQAAVGDVLANVLDYLGFKARREYYLNDEGNQINILGNSIALRLKELSGEKIEFPEDHYQENIFTI